VTPRWQVVLSTQAPLAAIGPLPATIALQPLAPGAEPGEEHLAADLLVLAPELFGLLDRLEEFRSLQTVQVLNAGVEWLVPHMPEGVSLCNASGVHDIPVAEWVVASVLSLLHGLPRYHDAQRRAVWDSTGNALTTPPEQIPGEDLHGKSVTIVGYGSIGRAVAARMAPFGVAVRGVTRHGRDATLTPDRLTGVLAGTDVLVLLCPLTDETRGLIDAEALAALPDGAIVVNAARGPVLDQDALEVELRQRRLRAALDVTDPEPLPDGHSLWTAPGLLLTPHAAGSSRLWFDRAYAFVGDQLRRLAGGEALHNVRGDY